MKRIKLDPKGRVSIPKSLRKRLGLDQETEFEVFEEEGRIVLTPLMKNPVEEIADVLGRVLPQGRTATEIQRELRAEWDEDIEKEASRARGIPK